MGRLDSETKFQKHILNAYNTFLNNLESITIKYEKMLRTELIYIADSTIDAFYEDYPPSSYERRGDIYNTYKITVKRNKFDIEYNIDFSPNFMKFHGRLNAYLFDIVFEQGWHGGAIDGEGHPEPGIPWYRNMSAIKHAGDNYDFLDPASFWLRRAAHSMSPYEVMIKKMDDYFSEWDEQYLNELDKCIDKVTKDFEIIIKHRG